MGEDRALVEPFLDEQGSCCGRPPRDHRQTLDAILWITRTGAPWRDLPLQLGKWNSAHRRFRRWAGSGLRFWKLTAPDRGVSRPNRPCVEEVVHPRH